MVGGAENRIDGARKVKVTKKRGSFREIDRDRNRYWAGGNEIRIKNQRSYSLQETITLVIQS